MTLCLDFWTFGIWLQLFAYNPGHHRVLFALGLLVHRKVIAGIEKDCWGKMWPRGKSYNASLALA